MVMEHRIYSDAKSAVAIESKSVIVCYDYVNQTTVPWTDEMRAIIDTFEAPDGARS